MVVNPVAVGVSGYRPCSSEPESGQIAVADRGAGTRHQQAIDVGHEAAEQGGGRHVAKRRSGVGHDVPFFAADRAAWLVATGTNLGIPDTSNNPFVCIAAFLNVHCSIIRRSERF